MSGSARTRAPHAAFIGTGFMAAVHSRAVRAVGGTPYSCVGATADRARHGAARLGVIRSHDCLDDALNDPLVDVVHVCTPNTTHARIARAALAAGKHVICEKPLATSVEDAEGLRAHADRARGGHAMPFIYRFHPLVREARARVRRGELGRVLSVQGSYLQDWLLDQGDRDWRVDPALGGPSRAFADVGSHLCDLIEFVSGSYIVRVQALVRTVFATRGDIAPVQTEDIAAVLFELSDGGVGTLLVSQVAPGRKNALAIELAGERASVRFEQENPEQLWIGRRHGSQLLLRDPANLSEDAARLSIVPAGHPMGYQDAFNAFTADAYARFAGGDPEGLPTFDDGLRSARIVSAVLTSSRSGQWTEVSPNDHVVSGERAAGAERMDA
ncbi:MAG: Gfo/Idh/MocA family oxidoreductase [Microbacterium sp.]